LVDTRWQYTFTHKQYIENTINNKTTRITKKKTSITNLEECWPCPVFANYTLAFALQLREKQGKPSVRVSKRFQSQISLQKINLFFAVKENFNPQKATLGIRT
jgi:hypothetical protein